MAVAVNILLDCTFSVSFSATDNGGGETFAGGGTYKMDKVTYKYSKDTADHGTGQDEVEFHRKNKTKWEIVFETKLIAGATSSTSLLYLLQTNELMCFVATALTGTTLTLTTPGALIVDIDADYAGPSTLKVTVKSRGTKPVIT